MAYFKSSSAKWPVLSGRTDMHFMPNDHDFGPDAWGAETFTTTERIELRNHWFSELPMNTPVDENMYTTEGHYQSYSKILSGGYILQVIMMDVNSFRSLSNPGGKGVFFGTDQLAWLRERLRETADIRLVTLGGPVMGTSGSDLLGNYPAAQEKFFSIIRDSGVGGVLFLSGDIHLTVVQQILASDTGMTYDTFDLTSSPFMQASTASDVRSILGSISNILYAPTRTFLGETLAQYAYIRLDFNIVDGACEKSNIVVDVIESDFNSRTSVINFTKKIMFTKLKACII